MSRVSGVVVDCEDPIAVAPFCAAVLDGYNFELC
ncbi:hypothetical protein EDF27_3062 [Curtobacterium sp. PhB136]|nr:hypothetical protein EDF27_3062 [Curtobacterium sp. PhB136]